MPEKITAFVDGYLQALSSRSVIINCIKTPVMRRFLSIHVMKHEGVDVAFAKTYHSTSTRTWLDRQSTWR